MSHKMPALTLTEPTSLPVQLAAHAISQPEIRIELRRGATTVNVRWPSSASAACAAWLREILR